MEFDKAKELFLDTQRRIHYLGSAASLLMWDFDTIMPKKAGPGRAETMGAVQGEAFRLQIAPEYGEAMARLREEPERLDDRQRRALQVAWREYDRDRKIPQETFEAYTVHNAMAVQGWKAAKADDDFQAFAPLLQKNIDFYREFAELWGYEKHPYDALLYAYDPALLTEQLAPVFHRLREGTVAMLNRIPNTPEPTVPSIPAAKQRELGHHLLGVMGYDLEAGNLYETEHPFACGIHQGDVRVTTHFYEDKPLSSIFSVLHEGGHGMYEQRMDPELAELGLMDGASMGIHESQSRFWENVVGRSLPFWQMNLREVNRLAGVELAPDPESFFRTVNHVRPSLIRIEADELTYNLHIIIRFELEKAIFNEGVNAADLPELWREKYREYLGIVPETDSQGVMQDTHWAGGMFGYFPSYTVGNLYAAQFRQALSAQVAPLEELIVRPGGLVQVADWLTENIYRYGKLEEPADILRRVTGGDLSPEPFLQYMEEKLKAVYGI